MVEEEVAIERPLGGRECRAPRGIIVKGDGEIVAPGIGK